MSFKMAGAIGFAEALAKAGTIVLEPISAVTIHVPVECQGDVVGDLNARRGRVHASESDGQRTQRIEATVPTSEILRYAVDLRSMTAGRGRFTFRHDHYDVLPPQQTTKLMASKSTDNGKSAGKKG
jgi:elongation factor G